MRRRILAPLLALILALTTGGVVFAVNYFGEDFCRDAKAWPGGSYLGQMHPFHVEIYSAHAGATGQDPCGLWALDQRYSAVRGLRELGYTVFGPGEFAWPESPPLISVAPDDLVYREISGYGASSGTMHLLRGVHTINSEFSGWHAGPVQIVMHRPDGTSVVVQDGLRQYSDPLHIEVERAGSYHFSVQTEGPWRMWTGKQPEIIKVPVRVEVEIEVPADLTVESCNAFFDSL